MEEAETIRSGADELGKCGGVSNAVIDVFEEDVGEEDFAVGDGQMLVNGGHNLLDWVGGGDGHELGPLIIEGIVKGEGKVDVGIVTSQSFDARSDADSTN